MLRRLIKIWLFIDHMDLDKYMKFSFFLSVLHKHKTANRIKFNYNLIFHQ